MSSCAFCRIAAAHHPVAPSTYLHSTYLHSTPNANANSPSTPTPGPGEDGHAFLILSTKHVLAFLDIMPLTRGHVLVVPRNHHEKLAEVGVRVSRELGTWLPILSRAVMRTVFGESTDSDPSGSGSGDGNGDGNGDGTSGGTRADPSWNWNVVQNNGAGAAQVVPHVHFHIVPRPPLGQASTSARMSFIMFGRGQREDLDDEEAEDLVRLLREEIAREVVRVKEVEDIDLEGEFRDAESGVAGGKGKL